MFFKNSGETEQQVSTGKALRHLVVFQIKLALDAIRDVALSPISIIVFALDVFRQPSVEDSLYLRLMSAGRQSDRIINLFDEYSDQGHYTVDETLAGVEEAVFREMQKDKRLNGREDERR
jgi:hypothetical protein